MEDQDGMKVARSSRAGDASPPQQRNQKKMEVCQAVLRFLKADGHPVIQEPGFAESLQAHFNSLPTRSHLTLNLPNYYLPSRDLLTTAS